jgi:hypothetical protein
MWNNIYRELENSTCAIVRADNRDPMGTGFLISARGHFLTACHVVQEVEKLGVRFLDDDRLYHFELVYKNYDKNLGKDIALCQIRNEKKFCFTGILFKKEVLGDFFSRGYGETLVDQATASGRFLGNLYVDGHKENHLYQMESPQAGEKGRSGAGIFSRSAGGIVALQTEAVIQQIGPQSSSFLAQPLYIYKNEIRKHVDVVTRVRWKIRSHIRSILFSPISHIVQFLLIAALMTGFVNVSRLYITYHQLSKFGEQEFIKANAQETAFWQYGPGVKLDGDGIKNNLVVILERDNLIKEISVLSSYYESLAKCIMSFLCINSLVCSTEYDRLWAHYHAYKNLWDQQQKTLNTTEIPTIRKLLVKRCVKQRDQRCRAVEYKTAICRDT